MNRRGATIVIALGLAAVVGCSSQRPASPEKAPTTGMVANVGSVVVTVSEALPADRQDRSPWTGKVICVGSRQEP